MVFIGLDDTDALESRGTGYLARQIAAALATDYPVLGVTRHQLLRDPRVPCTRNNSSAAIALGTNGRLSPAALLEQVRALMSAVCRMPCGSIAVFPPSRIRPQVDSV